MSIVKDGGLPTISGTAPAWASFISGEMSASRALLTAQLQFDGRLRQIARFSLAFNDVSVVARSIGIDPAS